MKIGYLDCYAGVAGDMILGALVDAGVPLRDLERGLRGLGERGWSLRARRVMRGGIVCRKVDVVIARRGHAHVRASELLRRLQRSRLPERVRADAVRVFEQLARAEAAVHGTTPARVEFHEVGAVDAIVDVAGACLGLHLLGVGRLHASPLPVTRGSARGEHGPIPVPGPATLRLLKGWPTFGLDVERELVTPTGAAIVTTLASAEPYPPLTIESVGCGAGSWEIPERPDFLRLVVGDPAESATADVVWLVETNLDNVSGELVGYLYERLLGAGAVDVFTTPIQMKKSRPGVTLSALVAAPRLRAVERILLVETPTFGVRRTLVERTKLAREERSVATPYGRIRVKVGTLDGRVAKVAPEFEDVRAAALKHRVPLAEVHRAASRAAERR